MLFSLLKRNSWWLITLSILTSFSSCNKAASLASPPTLSTHGSGTVTSSSASSDIYTFLPNVGKVFSIAFSSNGKYIVSGSSSGTVTLWSVAQRKVLREFANKAVVLSVDVSSDGKYVFSGSKDGMVKTWDVLSGDIVKSISLDSWPIHLKLSPVDSLLLVHCSSTQVKLFDTYSLVQQKNFNKSVMISGATRFSCNGSSIIITSGYSGTELDMVSIRGGGKLLRRFFGHGKRITSVDICDISKKMLLVSGSSDGTVRLWDQSTGAQVCTLLNSPEVDADCSTTETEAVADRHHRSIVKVKFIMNTREVIAAYFESNELVVKIWSVADPQKPVLKTTRSIPIDQHLKYFSSLDISSDGKHLVSGSADQTVKLWYLGERNNQKSLESHSL